MGPTGGRRLPAGAGGSAVPGPLATRPRPLPRAGVAWSRARAAPPRRRQALESRSSATTSRTMAKAHGARLPPPRRSREARARVAAPLSPLGFRGALPASQIPEPTTPAPAAHAAWPHSPSLAFFLRARVPPSFPKKESSFFRDGGDLGVGDLGTEGDFCGEVAMVVERTAADRSGTRSWCWAGASGLRLRLPKRKRNYSKHLRQLTLSFPFPLSLPRAALRPAGSCALGPLPWPGQGCSLHPLVAPEERMLQTCPLQGV